MQRLLAKFEAGMTLNRLGLIAAVLVFYEAVWLGAALYRLVVLHEVPPLGYDFSAFWSAAQLAAEGRVTDAFNGDIIGPIERSVVPISGTLYWHYPPTMNLLLIPFEHLGYAASFLLFTLTSCAAWIACAQLLKPDAPLLTKLLLVAAPGSYISVLQGQNGTFVALLLVLFLLALNRAQPGRAGFWGAVLLIKPHFGILLPLIVILRRQWRVFAWGLLFGGLFIALTLLRFGLGHWQAFFHNAGLLQAAMLTGELSFQQISAFAFFQLLGVPTSVALILQAITALAATALTWRIWHSETTSRDLKFATLLTGSLMISPYAFYYDTALMNVALFLLFLEGQKCGFLPGERTIYLLAYFTPALHRYTTEAYDFSIVFVAIILILWQIYRRTGLKQPSEIQASPPMA